MREPRYSARRRSIGQGVRGVARKTSERGLRTRPPVQPVTLPAISSRKPAGSAPEPVHEQRPFPALDLTNSSPTQARSRRELHAHTLDLSRFVRSSARARRCAAAPRATNAPVRRHPASAGATHAPARRHHPSDRAAYAPSHRHPAPPRTNDAAVGAPTAPLPRSLPPTRANAPPPPRSHAADRANQPPSGRFHPPTRANAPPPPPVRPSGPREPTPAPPVPPSDPRERTPAPPVPPSDPRAALRTLRRDGEEHEAANPAKSRPRKPSSKIVRPLSPIRLPENKHE